MRDIFDEMGCDLEKTYFDVPKMRSSTSDNYLTTGIAYAWHPHRDTWYSAPPCQINRWIPIYDIQSTNVMAFHPQYRNVPVKNSSKGYNHSVWNQQNRGAHAGGIILLSAAQMHSSAPNTSGRTRFSIDFRVVNLDDAAGRKGAPRVDEECTGTTMRDYLKASDLSHVPADLVSLYDDETADAGVLTYQHKVERSA